MESKKAEDKLLFTEPLTSLNEIKKLKTLLEDEKPNTFALSGLVSSARALFLYAIGIDIKKKLIILNSEQEARKLYDEYRFYDRNCRFFPVKDLLFYESDLRSNELTTERVRVLKDIVTDRPITVFTTIEALLNKLPPKESFKKERIVINIGEDIDLDELRMRLVSMGYVFDAMVSNPGEFSIRGGIVDIFPLTEIRPRRIELWDTQVDSIRVFDKDSQKSTENVECIEIYPASELVMSQNTKLRGIRAIKTEYERSYIELLKAAKTKEAAQLKQKIGDSVLSGEYDIDSSALEPFLTYFYENTSILTDYFTESSAIFLDDVKMLYDNANICYEQFLNGMTGRANCGYALEGQKSLMISVEDLFSDLNHKKVLVMDSISTGEPLKIKDTINIRSKAVVSYNGQMSLFRKDIKRYKKSKYRIIICGLSRARQQRLAEGLQEDEVECYYSENHGEPIEKGQILVTLGSVSSSVEFPDSKTVFFAESDIFGGTYKRRKKKSFKKGEHIESFRALNIGDYVVHENHGVGIYKGIEKINSEGVQKDFLKITYKGDDNLYVPVSQLDIITKYSGAPESKIKLNSLNGVEWRKTKGTVKMAVDDLAKELVSLYALRHQNRGFAYNEDTPWQREFEETFPYEETRGQLDAIEDVKKDLMSTKIMDRLICGDVGFGKTEIALRAAFKVVQENKQVAFLCPTTVLAKQHFNTFKERLKGYPVNIEMMSRFRTNSQNRKTAAEIKNGTIDIVIGTHRVLSKDVIFKDLGLLIIDEEQRFGVRHKEKIKMLKNDVDVLSLSATPIPRTLHMSLVGIRDMSLLDEAPLERLPIQTFVFEQNDEMVREAIERELIRGGQVYYVVNRIRDIDKTAEKIKSLVPQARVVYAHGQMNENELEDIMSDFVEGDIDVLVATTIIELGLDISNVNTIIVHDADNFGLSQLYQLRGRVGRSNRTAYAFLMYKRDKIIKEVARKRLEAIREFSDLGSGFKIAMRDLEIRGAGDIIGAKQHGHMDAVGYDLYCKMLALALKVQKGEEIADKQVEFETGIDIQIDTYVPVEYIPDESQKLEIYRRISFVTDEESEKGILDELLDRFGPPPKSVINLIQIAKLREKLHKVYVTKIVQTEQCVNIFFLPTADINPTGIPDLIDEWEGRLRFRADSQKPSMSLSIRDENDEKQIIPDMMKLSEDMYTSLANRD